MTRPEAGDSIPRATAALDVRFCGGCNPRIDRVAVAEAVTEALAAADSSANGHSGEVSGASSASGANDPVEGHARSGERPTLYVSGCQRACASGHRLRLDDEPDPSVVVAGEHVDALPTAADRIVESVIGKIDEPGHPVRRDLAADEAQSKE